MCLDFCSEAIVFKGNTIFLRGKKSCVDEDMKMYLEGKENASEFATFYPLEIGLSKGDITDIVHHILDYPEDGVCEKLKTLFENKDLTGLERLACTCREMDA